MKIVPIFADRLFAFHYENEADNELGRLLKLWNDTSYLYQFVTQHRDDGPKDVSILALINQIIENANDIDNRLNEISSDESRSLEEFFRPLHNQEYRIVELSKQKGRKNYLRIYTLARIIHKGVYFKTICLHKWAPARFFILIVTGLRFRKKIFTSPHFYWPIAFHDETLINNPGKNQ